MNEREREKCLFARRMADQIAARKMDWFRPGTYFEFKVPRGTLITEDFLKKIIRQKEAEMSGESPVRQMSDTEKILEESVRQRGQVAEIFSRLSNIRDFLIGSAPTPTEDEAKPSQPPMGGLFGEFYSSLYFSGQSIESIYATLRTIESALGLVAEKRPEKPPTRIGR
jgi:hypothetical protein